MEVLPTIGITGLIIGAITWLIRSIINQILSQDIEKFKTNLQSDSQQELLRLQSSLQLVQFEHQVRFSKLHERQAEIIAEIYSRLVELHRAAKNFVELSIFTDNDKNKERIKHLWTVVDNFMDYFEKHEIYFDEKVCSEINKLKMILSGACSNLISFVHFENNFKDKIPFEQIHNEWKRANGIMQNDVAQLKLTLQENFRNVLGVLKMDKNLNDYCLSSKKVTV